MHIRIEPDELLKLETWCATAGDYEISGVGTVRVEGDIHVERVWLLAGGTRGATEIKPEDWETILKEGVDPSTVKLWWHKHPVGNGVPGPENWSQTDEETIRERPLGMDPSVVKWSVSIVRTPYGWVGRVDTYDPDKTVHVPVVQPLNAAEHDRIHQLITTKFRPVYPVGWWKEWKLESEPEDGSLEQLYEESEDDYLRWLERQYNLWEEG